MTRAARAQGAKVCARRGELARVRLSAWPMCMCDNLPAPATRRARAGAAMGQGCFLADVCDNLPRPCAFPLRPLVLRRCYNGAGIGGPRGGKGEVGMGAPRVMGRQRVMHLFGHPFVSPCRPATISNKGAAVATRTAPPPRVILHFARTSARAPLQPAPRRRDGEAAKS